MTEISYSGSKSGVMPFEKYREFTPINLDDRQWPFRKLDSVPRWCSVDLRDGNQALIDPMTVDEKLRLYELLLDIGFLEIEVGFPAASKPDFDFIRKIITNGLVPKGVTLQVLCQARAELIERTIEAFEGADQAIFHLYNSTSTLQRRVVFGMSQEEICDLAVEGTALVRDMSKGLTGTKVNFEYSPESFTGTELDFAVKIAEAVTETWGATEDDKIIINLPSTVELSTPNIYADQIEYFCRNFAYRDASVISLHTHNDRGTGVAATELALMAGAERVEGTLFGNGERTGNCDLVTVAMNLFSQGIDPQLDLRDMNQIRETVEGVNKLPVHPRHPYAGDLVFTAFSGSHQDAIRKGMALVDRSQWDVPYLPIDPSDVGASYKESVRVNSQSGKGGIGFVLEEYFSIYLPREMLVEFSKHVQNLTETKQREISADEILNTLMLEYRPDQGPYSLRSHRVSQVERGIEIQANISVAKSDLSIQGVGENSTEAFVFALEESLNEPLQLLDHRVQALEVSSGRTQHPECLGIVTIRCYGKVVFGLGGSNDKETAMLRGVLSALNRRWQQSEEEASSN